MDRTVPLGAAMLLDFIGDIEAPKGYGTIYANKQHKLSKPLTSMTLGDVVDAQSGWSKNHGSSAAGRYQFMRRTLQDLSRELSLRGNQIFDEDLQDRLGYHLLKRRGYEAFMAGKINRTEFGKRLAQEWASLPVLAATKGAHGQLKRGDTYYRGDGVNKVLAAPEQVEGVLDRVKAAATASVQPNPKTEPIPQPQPVVVEKPVVADPGELGTPPAKSKTVWTWALAGIGSIVTAVGNFMGGLDWRVQLFVSVMIVAFAIYGIKRRNDLFKAVKDLKSELG